MSDGPNSTPAAWYDDPDDPTQLRYWDGQAWTDHRSPKVADATPADAAATEVLPVADATPADAPPAEAPPADATPADAPIAPPPYVEPVATGQTAVALPPAYAPTTGAVPAVASAPRKGAPWWLTIVLALVMLGAGTGLGYFLGSSGGEDDDKKADSVIPSESSAPQPSPDEDGDNTDGDNNGDEDRDSTKDPANSGPLPMTEGWVYNSAWYGEDGTVWEGAFDGIVEVPLHEYSEDEGRCFVIVGTMTPTKIADGALTTSFMDIPQFDVLADGQIVNEFGWCDLDAVEAAGYKSRYDAEVTAGTEYAFYHDVFLPASVASDIELVIVGRNTDAGELHFTPSYITLP